MSENEWTYDDQGYIDVLGGRIWYGIIGALSSGQVPLVCIHGGPGMSHDYLLPLIEVASDRPIIFYDQLDSGLSDQPNNPVNWTVARFVDEIERLRSTLDLVKVSIFGNSWGGTIAAAYAATQPVGLDRLILSSPLIQTSRWLSDNSIYRSRLPDDVLAVMDQCEANSNTDSTEYENAVDVFYKRHFCRLDPWPDYVMKTFELLNQSCYSGMWGPNEFTCTGVLGGYDGAPGLSHIKAPTLITCGQFDEATPDSCGYFSDLIPDAKLLVFNNASHLTFVEVRKKYIAEIRGFLLGAP